MLPYALLAGLSKRLVLTVSLGLTNPLPVQRPPQTVPLWKFSGFVRSDFKARSLDRAFFMDIYT